jgi:hypothetical protein
MGTHRKVVGAIHLAFGLLTFIPVMVLTAIFGGIFGVVAVATRGVEHAGNIDAIVGIGLGAILLVVVLGVAFAGALSIIAGAGVLLGHRWGDVLATVSSLLHVFSVPIGTALAVYTVWALWLEKGDRPLMHATP